MFAGIIQKKAAVLSVEKRGGSLAVRIPKPRGWRLKTGESISINGVCSTVRKQMSDSFEVEYMPATLKTTTMKSLKKGSVLNLERSLLLKDAVDGHFVQGHVDVKGEVISVAHNGSRTITISVPSDALKLMVPWGSVTIDGVSLTIQAVTKKTFTVALISHTLGETNLGQLKKGDEVNIETDMIARYLAHLTKK